MQGGKGELRHRPGRRRGADPPATGRPEYRGRRRARQSQVKAPVPDRHQGASGDGAGDRSRDDGQAAVRSVGQCHRQRTDDADATWRPRTRTIEFNIDKANQILDQAGYTRGSDGIRMTPAGVRMHVVYQTTINSLRQKEQDIVKDGWQQIGIETELKSVDASVFFSADAGNPDTNSQFFTDVEMFTSTFGSPFPLNYMKAVLQRKSRERRGPAVEQVGRRATTRAGSTPTTTM